MSARTGMSPFVKILPSLFFVALLGSLGCRNAVEQKPSTKDGAPVELAKPEPEPDEPASNEPTIRAESAKGDRPRISVETPQGQRVYLAGDHDPWADRVVSFKMGKPAAKTCTD